MAKLAEYTVRLALTFLNEKYRRDFAPTEEQGVWKASDPEAGDLSLVVAELFETSDAYRQKAAALEQALDAAHPGSYLLWVPPGGELPVEESEAAAWQERVIAAASRLASGRTGEARLPVRLAVGKVRDEGGYASVSGALGRYWTYISHRLQGSYYVDSRGLNRFTTNEEEREKLYETIADISKTLNVGEVTELAYEDAWTVQRMARGASGQGLTDGWAIGGAPEGFDPTDGGAIRRILRRRLSEAREVFSSLPRPWILVLAGAYEFMELENAGPALRGFDPGLVASLDGILLVADGEVKPVMLSRGLAFTQIGG